MKDTRRQERDEKRMKSKVKKKKHPRVALKDREGRSEGRKES